MTVTSQTCSCSQLRGGRTFYIKQRLNAILSEYFPLSKDAGHDYRAVFDDETQTLTIRKDI